MPQISDCYDYQQSLRLTRPVFWRQLLFCLKYRKLKSNSLEIQSKTDTFHNQNGEPILSMKERGRLTAAT